MSPLRFEYLFVIFLYPKVADWNMLAPSGCSHIMNLAQFYTLASNWFHHKSMKSHKIQPFVTPECFFPEIMSSHLNKWNVTSDFSLSLANPDFDMYFKTIVIGQRKLSLGLGGGGLKHYREHAPQCFLKRQSCRYKLGSRLVVAMLFWLELWSSLLEVKIETHH